MDLYDDTAAKRLASRLRSLNDALLACGNDCSDVLLAAATAVIELHRAYSGKARYIDQIKSERELCSTDAKRYRWIRSTKYQNTSFWRDVMDLRGPEMDAAIDAAIAGDTSPSPTQPPTPA